MDVFLERSCFFHDPVDVGNLISDSSAFSMFFLFVVCSSLCDASGEQMPFREVEATGCRAGLWDGHPSPALLGRFCWGLSGLPECWQSMKPTGSLGWENPLEEGVATHASILAWKIPWAEEPGGLPSMGSHRVGHD